MHKVEIAEPIPPTLIRANQIQLSDTFAFTGLLQAKNFHSVRIVDALNSAGWTGADACAWIASAQTDLPATGGIIDATGVTPTATCAGGITLGTATKPIWLQLGNVILTVNGQVQVLCSNCGITGVSYGSSTTILQGASFPSNTPVVQLGAASIITGSTVTQVRVNCNGAANSIGFENLNAEDFSGFVYDAASQCTKYGFWYEGVSGAPTMSVAEKLWSLHTGTATVDFYFHSVNNVRASYITSVANNGTDVIPAGISIDGGSISIDHVHCENDTICTDIGPTTSTIVNGKNFLGNGTSATLVKIENIANNRVNLSELISNASPTNVSDALVGEAAITDSYITSYIVLPGPFAVVEKADGKHTFIGGELRSQNAAGTIDFRLGPGSFSSTGLGMGTVGASQFDLCANSFCGFALDSAGIPKIPASSYLRFTETTAPSAAAEDRVYGDAAAHCLEASYNSSAFSCLPLSGRANVFTAINNFPGSTVALTADWTCGTAGTVASCVAATIIGSGGGVPLTFTLPLATQSYTLECDGVVGQATAVTANNWNLLTATNGATNVTTFYDMYTAATAKAGGATTDQTSTTTTFNIGPAWTLGGVATKMPFHVYAKIEGASISGTVVSLQLVAPTVADLVTIYRGASCRIF